MEMRIVHYFVCRSYEPVWIGCLQILKACFRQNVICQIIRLHKISMFAFSKSRIFTFAKHCEALPLQKRRWANCYFFFSSENQNSANTIRNSANTIGNTSSIPSPMYISSFIFSVSLYSSMYICYSVLSVSIGSQFSVPNSASFFILLAQ